MYNSMIFEHLEPLTDPSPVMGYFYFSDLSCFFIVMFDYYKTVICAVSLMSCWLLWQSVAVFAFYLRSNCILLNAR